MRKIFVISFLTCLLFSSEVHSDEGMWLLPLLRELNMDRMQELGFQLSADDIYSINNSSIKDAIVIFGGFCTGEIISSRGLLLTNHHCGYGVIQSHSSVDNDYLTNGFWAATPEDEIPSPDLFVAFLVRIEDVSERIEKMIRLDMPEDERDMMVQIISRQLEAEAAEGTGHIARVQPFFGGNQHYMMVYEIFSDIRLVGTPPSSIGRFGGDTDNWMWPRHTGDFALFRIYTAPDGSPAEYSEENIPLRPRYHLPVSTRGIEDGDFTMVLGYPGGTNRYMTSFEVADVFEIINPNRIKIRGIRQEIIFSDMMASEEVRIKYADKYSNSTNYWKYSIGQNEMLEKLNIYERKKGAEKLFSRWLQEDIRRDEKYGKALQLIEKGVGGKGDYTNAIQFINEALLRSCEILTAANMSASLLEVLTERKGRRAVAEEVENLRNASLEFYRDYNPPTDRRVVVAMLELFHDEVDSRYHPEIMKEIYKKYQDDFQQYTDDLFRESIFSSFKEFEKFLKNPSRRRLENDPAMVLAASISMKLDELISASEPYAGYLSRGQRLFIAGLKEQFPDSTFYPDANFSMRLSYGTAGGYHPRDGVWYSYFTTIDGKMDKEDPSHHEFVVPEKLKELYEDGYYGDYDLNGTLPVNFITNNDITGGNSGSPVINSRGELVGLVFDGNWEAMTSDIVFEPELQRAIAVDIRYVLFIIDKFAGAKHLIDEMTIKN